LEASSGADWKAPEHRRSPKRQRDMCDELAATFWSAALLRRFFDER